MQSLLTARLPAGAATPLPAARKFLGTTAALVAAAPPRTDHRRRRLLVRANELNKW